MAAQGLTSTSIQWGAWAGSGMAGNDAQTRARVERSGLGLVEIPAGLAALQGLLLTGSLALVAAVPIRWERFLAKQFVGQPPPVFAAFSRPAAATAPQLGDPAFSAASGGAPAAPAAGLSAAQRGALVLEQVQDAVRAVLGTTDTSIDQPLMAAGLDSLSSVELRNSLEERLGVQLPSTLVFDYPTISSIAGFVASQQAAAPPTAPTAASSAATFERLAAEVADAVSSILGANVSPDAPLMSAGLDSLGAVELRTSLEGCLGVELPPTLVFDYPTVHALTRHLASILQPLADATGAGGYVAGVPEWAGEAHVEGTSSLGAAVAVSALVTRQPAGALQRGSRGAVDALSSMALDRCA